MPEVGRLRPCCCTVSVEAVRKEQLVEQRTFVDERRSAGRLDCTDWSLEAVACQQLRRLVISSYLLVVR